MKNCRAGFAFLLLLLLFCESAYGWGFYGHRRINYLAVFLLPPEMLLFYKANILYLEEHAVDPDKRRYAVAQEGPRHYIDLDKYGSYPFDSLPRRWQQAVDKYGADSLQAHGIVPWWVQTMLFRLTTAFEEKDPARVLKLSADIGHYIADAHVPLHTSSNHDGQYSNQKGIHGFWESRIPELLAEPGWDLLNGRAVYIERPDEFIWDRVLESALASDSVLKIEKKLSNSFPADRRYSFDWRNQSIVRQYSREYTIAYDRALGGMAERRMRQAIFAVACFWYTAWVNAGQPSLRNWAGVNFSSQDQAGFDSLQKAWQTGKIIGRSH